MEEKVNDKLSVTLVLFGPDSSGATDKDRPLAMYRNCPCGCDTRDGSDTIGYLSTSNGEGAGITLFAPDEDTYQHLHSIFGGQR